MSETTGQGAGMLSERSKVNTGSTAAHSALYAVLALVMSIGAAGCHRVYVLPDGPTAPVADEAGQGGEQSEPQEARQVDSDRQLIAEAVLMELRGALAAGDWQDAWELLSHETRLVLDHFHPQGGDVAMAEGRLVVDGREVEFRPAHVLLVEELSSWRLLSREESEAASDRRIEAEVEGSGERRRVVLIREGMVWRLHSPSLERGRLGGPDD